MRRRPALLGLCRSRQASAPRCHSLLVDRRLECLQPLLSTVRLPKSLFGGVDRVGMLLMLLRESVLPLVQCLRLCLQMSLAILQLGAQHGRLHPQLLLQRARDGC